ncbi:SDR family NAD(P)-dependent oxidoreductase [Aminipila terrae]|uniref:SDR family oxidoreductase n=1 Tax=Aminipila terrae TaxID=2697030 RepID=A0A6P1MBJ7_9FIRM|nr:SDR family oxidoreductase [Aminipila terrae]QHI72079.1 SDR family oxidoreductase [Aminipila terrae]
MNNKQWIVVTGASSGIGRSTVMKLLEAGLCVVATARNEEKLNELYSTMKDVKVISWDLSQTDNIKEYCETVKNQVGTISGLMHCAGQQVTLPVHMIKEKKIEEVFGINTFAAMLLVSAFCKKGSTDNGASFVLVSSLAAHEGAFGKSIYAASKGALEGFIRAVSPELAEKGIRINAIAPGIVQTEMVNKYFNQVTEEQKNTTIKEYPLGLGKPEDVAELAVYLLSKNSRWVTGQVIIIDGGHLVRKC